jgi:hypothetical protein
MKKLYHHQYQSCLSSKSDGLLLNRFYGSTYVTSFQMMFHKACGPDKELLLLALYDSGMTKPV